MPNKKRVLFVCIENSFRSQMAEAFARLEAGGLIQADSASSRPSGRVNPKAVAVMAELGYDLRKHHSKALSDLPQTRYDYVITMGCGDDCPFIPADHHEDWDLPDPKELPLDGVRQVREEIRARVAGLARRIKE